MVDGEPLYDPSATDFDRDVYCVLGLPFDALGLREAAESVRTAARRRQRCFITTPNLNYVIACRTDIALQASVLQSDLSVADGMPLIWAARLLGVPLPERVAGSSLVDALRRIDAEQLSAFFFGGSDGVAAAACDALNETPHGLTCAGFLSPGFGTVPEMSTPEVHATINRSGADFLIVALPAKKGQMWILSNLSRLAPPIVANLGAVVNFVAGTVVRAPLRWQRLGLEWLWRIRQEPQLWRRYLHDGRSLLGLLVTQVFTEMIVRRIDRPSIEAIHAARATAHAEGDVCRLRMVGAWTAANLQALRNAVRGAVEMRRDVMVDLGEVAFLDRACIGLLLLLRGHQAKVGRRLTMSGPTPTLLRQLRRSGAAYLLT